MSDNTDCLLRVAVQSMVHYDIFTKNQRYDPI